MTAPAPYSRDMSDFPLTGRFLAALELAHA